MALIDDIHAYNAEMLEFLKEVWSAVPQGRQKQLVKQPRIKALLDRYGIEYPTK